MNNKLDNLEEMDKYPEIYHPFSKTGLGRNRQSEKTNQHHWNWISNQKYPSKSKSMNRQLHRGILRNT